ncbi:MAG: Gfo/Idh/MocA family oxidoreductase [Acidobacteriota bacterium]|nr:Gfo/Idh/MocA family oxidoreductase [Acidobacteriota bacterium]
MKTYRVGIIGLGRMGCTICDEVVGYKAFKLPYSIAGACAESPRLEFACGADLDPAKREACRQRWGCSALYEDFLRMIEQERPDMVAICTKGENHAELAMACADSGVPMMYLEKAMACSMVEADGVRDAIARNHTVFNTGVLRRFGDHYKAVRAMIADGLIGEPRAVIQKSGGSLLHSNIHAVDFAMFMLGDPRAVRVWGELPRGTEFVDNRLDHDPGAVYRIEFEGGAQAWQVPFGNHDVEIVGSAGIIECLNNGMDFVIRKPEEPPLKWTRYLPEVTGIPVQVSATVACLEDLVDAYETGRPTLNNIDVAHHSTEICFAAAESHRLGGVWVDLPLENRELYVWHV